MDEGIQLRGDILLVDDHPPSLQLLTAILTKQGHDVRSVMTGKMALIAAQTEPPDLVLLDIRLPDMDGYAVCRQLKADERMKGVPIIFISSPESKDDKMHAFEVGAVDYITKPFQIDDVVARVESQLTLRRIYEQAHLLAMVRERERLARDLHDAVNQTIFSISMISETLLYQAKDHSPTMEQGISQIHQLSRIALSELRILLFELRPDNLLRAKLGDLLRQLTKTLSIRANVHINLHLTENASLPTQVHLAFYRIAQEGLNNIIRHAEANEITIELETNKAQGRLVIQDNGVGFVPEKPKAQGFGLRNMQERAKSINAEFTIASAPTTGTTLTLLWHVMSDSLLENS